GTSFPAAPGSAPLLVFQTIALTTLRAGHQYAAVSHLCRVHLRPYRCSLRRLVAICMGKDSAANIERRRPNIEFHTEPSALGVGWFDVRCSMFASTLDTR